MTINKSQGQTFEKICFSLQNLYSVMGNYMLLSQEFNHWSHEVLYLRWTRLLTVFTTKYMNK
jgi:hypothetical protein